MKRHLLLAAAVALAAPARLPGSDEGNRLGQKALERMFGEILDADGEALRILDRSEPRKGKFRFGALQADLAVSATGILAPLALRGTAGVSVVWEKHGEAVRAPGDEAGGDLELTPESTRADLRRQLEPIVQMAIQTQKVKGADQFREDVYEHADRFFELTRVVAASPPSSWWVSRFRFDLWVDVEGKIHPGVSAGAEFKLRFEFHRLMGAGAVPLDAPTPLQKKFKEFIAALGHDARAVSAKTFEGTGFYLSGLSFGVGFTAKGNVGLVKFGGGVEAYLYLSAPAPGTRADDTPDGGEPLALIEDGPRGPFEKLIYQLDRAKFRRGLARAATMSSWLAKRAGRARAGKWGVYELLPYFELSIGADFKIVAISGSAGMGICLINGDFH